ncbi:hypothetical protein WMY93_013751 [Mugilogobius chulae]|uniref:BHLH domain-containing protein n=1 Tax=Mugilogobius chulae TaxID=88201 RepID=A0AAW0P4G0_9GOBI
MDSSAVLDYSLQYQWCSDSDISNLSSPSLSPVSSMDSSLSPSYQHLPHPSTKASNTRYSQKSRSGRKVGQARTRIRSKQRESASEKEKLRMRDLTKALHHLRSFLPPSVAPAGQTLTKIETLRLTIRYISYLSAQLGLSEEVLFQRREHGDMSAHEASSPDLLSYFQPRTMRTQNSESLNLNQSLNQDFYSPQPAMVHPGSCSFGTDQYSRVYSEVPPRDVRMDCVLQSPPESQPSYQSMLLLHNGKGQCLRGMVDTSWSIADNSASTGVKSDATVCGNTALSSPPSSAHEHLLA